MSDWLIPDWPAPASVKACVTTRGRRQQAPFDSLNLGDHVDDRLRLSPNRRRLTDHFSIKPAWLQQVHGIVVAHADRAWWPLPMPAGRRRRHCLHGDDRRLPAGVVLRPCRHSRRGGPCRLARVGGRRAGSHLDSLDTAAATCWSGSARPLARKPLKSARKCAKPSSATAGSGRSLRAQPQCRQVHGRHLSAGASAPGGRGVTAVYGGGFCTVTDPRFFSYRRASARGALPPCLAHPLSLSDLHQLPTLESPRIDRIYSGIWQVSSFRMVFRSDLLKRKVTHAYRPFNQQIAVGVVRCPIPGRWPRPSGHRAGALDAGLLEQQGGSIKPLLMQVGFDINSLRKELTKELDQLPKIQNPTGDVNMSQDLARLLNQADRLAQQKGDQFISSELVLLAAMDENSKLGNCCSARA
jgi:hypothetical protein